MLDPLGSAFAQRQPWPGPGDANPSRATASTKRRVITVQPGELALRMKRVVRAPASAVFRACTEPEELAKWWGPRGFTTSAIEIDLRVGGRYRFAMQPPEGDLFHLTGEFREVDPPSRLVYTFLWEPPDPDDRETVVTLSFRDLDGSTQVDFTQGVFATGNVNSKWDLAHIS
jgi:uncharacterized protein YndB with AHSA1/START domain